MDVECYKMALSLNHQLTEPPTPSLRQQTLPPDGPSSAGSTWPLPAAGGKETLRPREYQKPSVEGTCGGAAVPRVGGDELRLSQEEPACFPQHDLLNLFPRTVCEEVNRKRRRGMQSRGAAGGARIRRGGERRRRYSRQVRGAS